MSTIDEVGGLAFVRSHATRFANLTTSSSVSAAGVAPAISTVWKRCSQCVECRITRKGGHLYHSSMRFVFARGFSSLGWVSLVCLSSRAASASLSSVSHCCRWLWARGR